MCAFQAIQGDTSKLYKEIFRTMIKNKEQALYIPKFYVRLPSCTRRYFQAIQGDTSKLYQETLLSYTRRYFQARQRDTSKLYKEIYRTMIKSKHCTFPSSLCAFQAIQGDTSKLYKETLPSYTRRYFQARQRDTSKLYKEIYRTMIKSKQQIVVRVGLHGC